MNPIKKGDPGKLRSAISALRFVLKHPMTSHLAESEELSVSRPNVAMKQRQVPRREFKPREKNRRQRTNRSNTELDNVLDSMNKNVDAMTKDDKYPIQPGLGKDTSNASEPGMKNLIRMVNKFVHELQIPSVLDKSTAIP